MYMYNFYWQPKVHDNDIVPSVFICIFHAFIYFYFLKIAYTLYRNIFSGCNTKMYMYNFYWQPKVHDNDFVPSVFICLNILCFYLFLKIICYIYQNILWLQYQNVHVQFLFYLFLKITWKYLVVCIFTFTFNFKIRVVLNNV